jgi:hypothetical protein
MRGPIVSTKWKIITCPQSIVVDVRIRQYHLAQLREAIWDLHLGGHSVWRIKPVCTFLLFSQKIAKFLPKTFRRSPASYELKEKNHTLSQKVIMANYAITRFGIFLHDLLLSLKCCYHHQFSK